MEDWMKDLPTKVQQIPIKELAIPGSHDSGAYFLDPDAGFAAGTEGIIKHVGTFCCCCGKKVILNWSLTQSLTFKQQLERGIRYLDIRSGYDSTRDEFFLVHTLYGFRVSKALQEVKEFLDAHPKEVVILDFNQLRGFDVPRHTRFAGMLNSLFSAKLLGPSPGVNASLQQIWAANKQVILIYNQKDIVNNNQNFWPSSNIISPFPNTNKPAELVQHLDDRLSNLTPNKFNVFQGILTPTTSTILLNLCGTLEDALAMKANRTLDNWLATLFADRKKGVNILICDYVEIGAVIAGVVKLNHLNAE